MVVVQVYDEDRKRQELISECELDISNVLAIGEEDSKSIEHSMTLYMVYLRFIYYFRLVSFNL